MNDQRIGDADKMIERIANPEERDEGQRVRFCATRVDVLSPGASKPATHGRLKTSH